MIVIPFASWKWQDWELLTVTGSDVTELEVQVPSGEVWCFAIQSFRYGIGRTVQSDYSNLECALGFSWYWRG